MHHITICIPTYKRPFMLNKLVKSIIESNLDITLINDLDIIVVDNDIDKSAELLIREMKVKHSDKLRISYFSYPIKGLSNVRNELIKKAILLNPDFLIFVDDDEHVTPDWLNELVKTIIINNGDLTMGPVISIFENNVSRYISIWFDRLTYPNNSKLNFIRTGNLIINTKSLIDKNILFDHRFNTRGSEDSYFGIQMVKKSSKIYWAAKAIVYETIPSKRATLKWLIKRRYNGANTYIYMLKLEKNYIGLIKKTLTDIVFLFLGGIALVVIPFPFKQKYWSILRISESIGGFTGLFGIQFHEYKEDR